MKKTLVLATVVLLLASGIAFAGLNDGLVAYYPFNGNANDESGNGNHGTVNGAAADTDRFGQANSAYDFNGYNHNIVIGDVFDSYQKMTIAAWVALNSPVDNSGDTFGIVEKRNADSEKTFSLYWIPQSNGKFQVRFYGDPDCGSDSCWVGGLSTTTTTTDIWYFVAATFDSGSAKLYINGLLEDQNTSSISIPNTNADFMIGSFSDGRAPFHGKIDDVRIYSRALSATEVQQLYWGGGKITSSGPTDCSQCPTNCTACCEECNCASGGCIQVGSDLSIPLDCANYKGTDFSLTLEYDLFTSGWKIQAGSVSVVP